MSGSGSSFKDSPGADNLLKKPILFPHTGSVNMFNPRNWIRKVECPIHVIVFTVRLFCKNRTSFTSLWGTVKLRSFAFARLSFCHRRKSLKLFKVSASSRFRYFNFLYSSRWHASFTIHYIGVRKNIKSRLNQAAAVRRRREAVHQPHIPIPHMIPLFIPLC